jgi:hypothetical protein
MKIISVKPHGIRIFIGERINLKLESHQRPGGLRMGAVEITGVELANIRDRITVNEKPVELGNVKVSPSKITLTWKQWGAKPRDELLILVGQLLDGKPIKLGRVETMLSSLFIRQDRVERALSFPTKTRRQPTKLSGGLGRLKNAGMMSQPTRLFSSFMLKNAGNRCVRI